MAEYATKTVATAPMKEIGYAQAPNYNWWLYEDETTPELIWPQSVAVYDTMRRTDSQVTSVIRAMTLPVRSTPWRIDPNGARDEVVEFVAQDLGLPIIGKPNPPAQPRQKDRFSWPEHLRHALLMLPYGHMYFEQVYRVDEDGQRAHLRKLAPRMPKTIERIDVAADGGLLAIKQWWTQTDSAPRPIPVDRLVAYIHEREGGNWLGRSILRPAYKNWLLKDRLLRVQALTIERNGMGIPLYTGQEDASSTDLAAGMAMAQAWRSGQAAGTAVPHGAELTLVGVSGTLPDAEPAVRYHDEQIGRAVLAHFLNLGTQTGSWALGTTFADFFTLSLQTLAQQIADTATCHIVEDLVDINFGPDEPAPKIVFDEIGSRQAATAQALAALFAQGAVIPDENLEEMLRQQYGLPPRDPDSARTPPTGAPGVGSDGVVDTGGSSVAASAGDEVAAKFNPAELRDAFGRWAASLKGRGRKPKVERAPSLSDLAAELDGLAPAQSRAHLRGVGLSEVEIDDLIGPDAPMSMSDLAHELEGLTPAESRVKLRQFGFTDAEIRDLLGAVVSAAADGSDDDDESEEDLDDEDLLEVAALLAAMAEFAGEVRAAAFDPSKHMRYPKGHPLAGKFRPMVDLLVQALNHHHTAGGKGDPFAGFKREQLRRAAKTRGLALKRGASRDDIRDALVADLTPGGKAAAPKVSTVPGLPTSSSGDPAVKAAKDVLYGADPKSKTAARQIAVYGALRRTHFDSLDPQEQSTLLGDLSYIATTSKGPNAGRAQTLIDRFTPPGTPAGTTPKQSIIPPASAVAAQMRVADPTGTPGLLSMLPAGQRGLSGDGWTRTASGGTGPWGQYGAAGLMLRHVDANGEERFLMVERGPGISDPGKWQFPGGAKEEKESFYEGAAREVIEELGFKPSDLDGARVHGTHTNEVPSVKVPGLHGGTVPWAYVSVVATVPTQLTPDLSTHHARMETSDAKWMTAAEIRQLDTGGKLLRPLAGGQLEQNVMSLFPTTAGRGAGRPAPRTTRPNRLVPGASSKLAHKPSRGVDLIGTKASKDKLRQDVKQARKRYAGKVADDRLAAIGAMQGYDETPTVVSKADFDRLLATGDYTEAWRGVRGAGSSRLPGGARGGGTVSRTKTAAEVNEDMRSGIAYYGTGVFGNGYYLAEQKSVAAGYTDGTKNSLVRVLIPKSANVVDHADARKGASGASTARSKAKGSSYEDGTLYDEGRYAAAKGFAGIRITHTSQMRHGGSASHIASPKSPAWNWLDRSTLIVQEAEA